MLRRTAVLSILLGATVFAVAPRAALAQAWRLSFEDVLPLGVDDRVPSELAWSRDGSRLGYLWDDGQGQALWLLEPAAGAPELLVRVADVRTRWHEASSAGESATGPGAEGGELEAFHWSPRGDGLLLELDGDLCWLSLPSRELKRLTSTLAEESDAKFSPDGGSVAFVRDHDLHLLDLATGSERPLTSGGEENVALNGETDWVYWEEIWNRSSTGYWWSPRGTHIAYYHFDESPVRSHSLVDFTPQYPEVEWQKYPAAGEANPVVKVGVRAVAGGETVWMDTGGEDAYLARVRWTPRGDGLAIQRLNRDQNRLDLLLCRPEDGRCHTLLTEEWPTWVNLGDELRFLKDGRFVWGSDRSGWRRLYLHAADGRLVRQLSPDGWAVASLNRVDEKRDELVFTGFETAGLGAARRQVLSVGLGAVAGASGVEMLAPGDGWSSALVAPRTGYWVHTWSDANTPPTREVRGGRLATPLELPSPPAPAYDAAALPRWELLTIEGPGGVKLPARLLRPQPFDPKLRYPVIMYHYGGPGSQVVVDRWGSRGRGLWHKLMAQRGYLVLCVDNEASLFFGKRGEDRVHRRFGEVNLSAQRAAVAYLASLPYVDATRIGLWGWSGGGTNTLYCLLNAPGTWRAGVAGAPVTDWHLYDSIWTERYLDHPKENPEGYASSSPVTHAAKLRDRLLIVHGMADDNVHPQNTLVMIRALVEAELPFENAIYPRQKHGFKGRSSRHFYRRLTEFLERQLAPGVS